MKRFCFALAISAASFAAAAGQAGAVKTIPAAGIYIVNAPLNLRDSPDLSGKVVGQVAKGTKVEVVEMSYLMYQVQGMRAAWFRIKKPSGWVYGYYLDPSSEAPSPRDEH